MNKSKPHHQLSKVKDLINAGQYDVTRTALGTAAKLDIIGKKAIGNVLLNLTHANFYKSTTTDNNNKEWQDVYHGLAPNKTVIYIKFTIRNGLLVLSFKEKTE